MLRCAAEAPCAAILRDAAANRGTTSSAQARDTPGLQDLLPPLIETLTQQVAHLRP